MERRVGIGINHSTLTMAADTPTIVAFTPTIVASQLILTGLCTCPALRVDWRLVIVQIQQRSGSSSIDGFIKKTGAEWGDKNFDRYFRNEGKSKKPLMDQGS